MNLTLKQLAAQLNELVAENEKSGRAERNDLPAMIRVSPPARKKGQHYKTPVFYTVNCVPSCMTTFWSENPVTGNKVKVAAMTVETKSENQYKVVPGPAITTNQ